MTKYRIVTVDKKFYVEYKTFLVWHRVQDTNWCFGYYDKEFCSTEAAEEFINECKKKEAEEKKEAAIVKEL